MSISGEGAALLAAFLWSVSAVLFGRMADRVSPLGLNFLKGLVAIGCLAITIHLTHDPFPWIPSSAILILLLSGAIGIGIGDTFYFGALHTIGSRKTLLMKALSPPSAAIGALILLQEWLNWQAWGGILLTIVGVTWVISERTKADEPQDFNGRGLILGLLAALTDALGAGVVADCVDPNADRSPVECVDSAGGRDDRGDRDSVMSTANRISRRAIGDGANAVNRCRDRFFQHVSGHLAPTDCLKSNRRRYRPNSGCNESIIRVGDCRNSRETGDRPIVAWGRDRDGRNCGAVGISLGFRCRDRR